MYPPELVGATSHMSIGRKCHVYTVLYNLEVLGYAIDFAKAEKIAALVQSSTEPQGLRSHDAG